MKCTLVNTLPIFCARIVDQLDQRLQHAGSLGPVVLRVHDHDPELVVLTAWRPGDGVVKHSIPARCLLDPGMRLELDRELDAFLLSLEADVEVPSVSIRPVLKLHTTTEN